MKANPGGKWICVAPAPGHSQECSGGLSLEGRKAPKKPGAGFVVVPALCTTDEVEFGSWLEEVRE